MINTTEEPLDTARLFEVDDYPISDAHLKGKYDEVRSGQTKSYDIAWFVNPSLHQAIVFELYTDYHRFVTFCFDYQKVPDLVLERLGLHDEQGELATLEQKKKDLQGFIDQAKQLDENYFVSNNGIALGMKKEKAFKLNGEPTDNKTVGDIEILEWNFSGDMADSVITEKVAQDSFGHSVTMFFEKDKLVAQVLFNDIP